LTSPGDVAGQGFLRRFFATEAAGGALLGGAALVAVAWANSPAHAAYFRAAGHARFTVNTVLMAGFFFLIGLEVRREIRHGELREWRVASTPVLAAVGGMAVPALLYLAVAHGAAHPAAKGWGIPMATDIAFTLGVLALLGDRVPRGLKLFMLTLAVADDIAAVVVLALVSWKSVGAGDLVLIAAVVVGLAIPPGAASERLEVSIHPWIAFGVLPLFAVTNTGVRLIGSGLGGAGSTRVLVAIVVARLVGKAIGITAVAWLVTRLRVGVLPAGVGLGHIAGASVVAAVGFTVPLYFTAVAFEGSTLQSAARAGLLLASVIGFVAGAAALVRAGPGSQQASGGAAGLPLSP
jgi:NhaA family Na+:H+ antiporter